jgi:hypothetical protein
MTNGAREPGWTLRRRLQAIITLALLPVVLVSIFQGVARFFPLTKSERPGLS